MALHVCACAHLHARLVWLKRPLTCDCSVVAVVDLVWGWLQQTDGKDGGEDEASKSAADKDNEDKPEKVEEQEGQDEEEGGEGPVNDDLEDNYEDKPMGVEVGNGCAHICLIVVQYFGGTLILGPCTSIYAKCSLVFFACYFARVAVVGCVCLCI